MSHHITTLLEKTTAGELLKDSLRPEYPQEPICLDSELTVLKACETLAKYKISSAPVYNTSTSSFIGLFDYRDLLVYLLRVFHKVPKDQQPSDINMELQDVVKLALAKGHNNVAVKNLSNLSTLNPLVLVEASASLLQVIKELASHKLHRILVIKDNVFLGVLSQSAIASFIAKNFGLLSPQKQTLYSWEKGEKSIEELGLVQGQVMSISPDDSVLDALYMMNEHHISSVAIVKKIAEGSQMCGSISLTDIKEIIAKRAGWHKLMQPAMQFFVQIRNEQAMKDLAHERIPSFCIPGTTQVIRAIERMVATKVHRLWVESPDGKTVVGVVSLSDIMSLLAQ